MSGQLPTVDLNQSILLRSLLVIPLALAVTACLFTVLSNLTSPGDLKLNKTFESPELNFLLVRKESDLELRDRERPRPPEEVKEVENFEFKQPALAETLSIDVPSPDINMPNIDIDMQMDMTPALANLKASNMSAQLFAVDIPFQQNPRAIKDVPPRYPSKALRKKIQGRLKAEFVIDEQGFVKPETIKFVEVNPEGVFEKAAMRSLKRSRFEPMMVNGQAVAYRAGRVYEFQLPKKTRGK